MPTTCQIANTTIQEPDRGERDQPDQRPRFAFPIDENTQSGNKETGQHAAERSVHPIGERQRQFAAPMPREIVLRSERRQWRRERVRRERVSPGWRRCAGAKFRVHDLGTIGFDRFGGRRRGDRDDLALFIDPQHARTGEPVGPGILAPEPPSAALAAQGSALENRPRPGSKASRPGFHPPKRRTMHRTTRSGPG